MSHEQNTAEMEKNLAELRKSLRQVEDSEERYRTIVESSPNGMVILDLKGNVTFCNKAFLELTGFVKEDVSGKKFTKLPHLRKLDIPRYIRIFNSLIKGKKPKPFQVEWEHKDGTTHASEVHIGFARKNGRISGIVAIARDITEQQMALDDLNVNEKKYKNLFHQSNDAIFIHDIGGNIQGVNKKARELFGYNKPDLLSL